MADTGPQREPPVGLEQPAGEPVESEDMIDGGPLRRQRVARKTLVVLPTLCTLFNVLCGFLAIFFATRAVPGPNETGMPFGWTPLTYGAVFVFMGMVLDALDGRLARLTNHTSNLGAQLDSMADMVTFGVAPAFLAAHLVVVEIPFLSDRGDLNFDRIALVIACIYVACTALRLARFNIEMTGAGVEDHMSFEGLPTPGAAGTVASLVLLHEHARVQHDSGHWTTTVASVTMVAVMLLVAIAMISRLRYVHVTNRLLRDRAPIEYIAVVVVVALLVTINLQIVLAAMFLTFAMSAPVHWVMRRWRSDGRDDAAAPDYEG